jgi:hypothetical protein
MFFLAEIDPSLAGVLILAGLIAIIFTLGRLIKKHTPPPDAGAASGLVPGRVDAITEARLRKVADRLMTEMESLGREARGEVETRVRVLAELLARADVMIEGIEGAKPVPPPPRFEEVYRLADEGLDPASVAERTSFERGEVELILGIRTRTTASGRLERVERPRPPDVGEDRA